ncbi:MAG: UDP-N-acetylglucosamine 2-epimerase (non-hydrolyzing) [Thermodesulfobacteriota bacterium]
MKIMTVLGTRPEIIRLSLIIKALDKCTDHTLVHTGQNYDLSLGKIFFDDLQLRKPDYYLGVKAASFAEQIAKIFTETEKVIKKVRPDRLLILGDTNSGLVSIVARRMGIPVYHMEAGNRCFDGKVPEEVNRRVIDHSSNILLPYTHGSRENLLREGIEPERIYVVGNPINEVINSFSAEIDASAVHKKLKLEHGKYFLVTLHREENVDDKERLSDLFTALKKIQKRYKVPVICSLHPRTKARMKKFGLTIKNKNIVFLKPLGFFDFISLEKAALCVITDSGTVQEECCIFKVPNVTAREVTERPETVEVGSNILAGTDPETILSSVRIAIDGARDWQVPTEYQAENVTGAVVKIITGFNRLAIYKK